MVFHGLDHHAVLLLGARDLHPPRAADPGVRHVAVAADLVRGVDDHDAAERLVREEARELADGRRLADARAAEEQDRAAGEGQVGGHGRRAAHRAADAAREPDDDAAAVADRGDPVQRRVDACAIVAAEVAARGERGVEVRALDGRLGEARLLGARKARERRAAEVEHDLHERGQVGARLEERAHARREERGQREDLGRGRAGRVGHARILAAEGRRRRRRRVLRPAVGGGGARHRRFRAARIVACALGARRARGLARCAERGRGEMRASPSRARHCAARAARRRLSQRRKGAHRVRRIVVLMMGLPLDHF